MLSKGGWREGGKALFFFEKKTRLQIFCKALNEELCQGWAVEDIIWSPTDSSSLMQNNYFFYEAIKEDRFKWLLLGCPSMWPTGFWEWQLLRVSLKLTIGIWDMSPCLELCDTSLVSELSFLFFCILYQELLFFFITFFPKSFSFTDSAQNGQTSLDELVLIQILWNWFVQSLCFCSCLIELCCSVSTIRKELLFFPSHFPSDCVSCSSLYSVLGRFMIISTLITMPWVNAAVLEMNVKGEDYIIF